VLFNRHEICPFLFGERAMKTPLRLLLLSLVTLSTIAHAQEQQQQSGDVLRVNTELVQTEVLVLDGQERFVEGIGREQFELRVDGKPVPVSFLERVSAGSVKEEQLAAARAGAAVTEKESPGRVSNRGRTIIFFIDDFHLSAESLQRARKSILYFIDKEMSVSDQVMIASATGQIGFLQQFSDNKAVLRAALERLVHKPYVVRDVEGMGMTEYQALRIEQGDSDALYYYVNRMEQETRFQVGGGGKGGPSKEQIAKIIRERAKFMLKQSANVTTSTLKSLESLMQVSAPMAGRKVVFFFSDGFYLNDRNSDARDRLQNIADAALRAGAVIYSLDTRGLVLPEADASSGRVDPIGQLARANAGELAASQDPLTALASDTGGRARLNTYTLIPAVERALKDNSNYYLLAWRPDEEQRGGKFRKVEVSIKGRPELTVRLPRGYLVPEAAASARTEKTAAPATGKGEAAKTVDADFREALTSFTPKRAIPTLLSTSYLDTPNNGMLLTASVQVSQSALAYGADGKQPAAVDIAGVVLNDQGKPAASFKTRLNVNPRATETAALDEASVIYNYKSPLKPGLYQVRVAARDDRSGKVGSSMQWIEIPDLTAKRLTLSSLLIGGQLVGSAAQREGDAQVQFSVDRRFRRSAHLGFWIFIYNAGRDAQGQPDVTAQVQIFRDAQAIVNTQPRKLSMAGITDMGRIPYGGDFALSGLAPGRYILQITITDRAANASASERTSFTVE
jgi:VWFA-related protein